jgi:hypothetical protein
MGKIHLYKAKDGWRWRAITGGRIVAESGEGYTQASRCYEMADKYGPDFGVYYVAIRGKKVTVPGPESVFDPDLLPEFWRQFDREQRRASVKRPAKRRKVATKPKLR